MISIVIPVYNEERSVSATIDKIKKTMSGNYEIIAVNDGSKDRTAKILKNIPGITVITHNVNRGHGASLKSGIRKAKGEKILITDADGTYPPEAMPRDEFLINVIKKIQNSTLEQIPYSNILELKNIFK